MVISRSASILVVALCGCCGCGDSDRHPLGDKKMIWPLSSTRTMPAEIVVQSGTTFRCGGVPCQLLGVKEREDSNVRKQAEEFTKAWFKSIGNYIGIYNDSNPLVAEDGTAVVWIRGYDCYLSCLSEELVRAGLVEVDESQWPDYTFDVPTKSGDAQENWRGILHMAKEGHKQGEKLRVLFDWPQK
jgi:hypothetical protein